MALQVTLMARCNDYDELLTPYLTQLENEIEANSANLTSNAMRRAEESLTSIIARFNEIRNSRVPINRINSDILYHIFSLASDSDNRPCALSQVCRHWRKSALGWPTLWSCIELSNSDEISELYVQRSRNVPLTLICLHASPKLEFLLNSPEVLSRLCSLTLHLPCHHFIKIWHAFQCFRSPLRYLDTGIYDDQNFSLQSTDFLPMEDISSLQELSISNMGFPPSKLSHDRLSHLVFRVCEVGRRPPLSQLLDFLSGCPLLYKLELDIATNDVDETEIFQSIPANQLDLLNLKILNLRSDGIKNYFYLRRFLSSIRSPESLFQLELVFYYRPHLAFSTSPFVLPSFNDPLPVPLETLSYFADECFLFLLVDKAYGYFVLFTYLESHPFSYSPPLYITDLCSKDSSFDPSPFLKFMRTMAAVTHLVLRSHAWEALTLWNLNIQSTFPCLDTLELSYPHKTVDTTKALNSLHAGLKLKTLSIGQVPGISFRALAGAITRTGTKILELDKCFEPDKDYNPYKAQYETSPPYLRRTAFFIIEMREWGLTIVFRYFDPTGSACYYNVKLK